MRDVNSLAHRRHVEETLIGTSQQLGHTVSPVDDRRPICDARRPETGSLETGNRIGLADRRDAREEKRDIRRLRRDPIIERDSRMKCACIRQAIGNEICETR